MLFQSESFVIQVKLVEEKIITWSQSSNERKQAEPQRMRRRKSM